MLLSSDRLLRSAMASKLAYSETHPLSIQLHGNRITMIKVVDIKKTGSHAYLYRSGNNAYLIAFRGSHDVRDLRSVLDCTMKPFHYREASVNVHSGVFKMFESIEPTLSSELMGANKVSSLTLCGHSLGGSIANFAAAYYGSMFNKTCHVTSHTFGAPIVGDDKFTAWYTQYVNESIQATMPFDFVCALPFHCMYKSLPHDSCGNQIMDPIKSHDLDTYIDQIEKLTRVFPLPKT
jgi:hypothetical protein